MSEFPAADTNGYGKCADCPFVIRTTKRIEDYEANRDDIIRVSMDDSLTNDRVKISRKLLEHLGLIDYKDEITLEIFREKMGIIDAVTAEHIEELRASLQERRRGCMGSVVLTGTTPEGSRLYSAKACSSPRLPNGESSEELYVRRDRI